MASKDVKRKQRLNPKGQILVEYVLLLIIAVTVAALIVNTIVSRDPEEPGFLIRKWNQILEFIGDDLPDDIKRGEDAEG